MCTCDVLKAHHAGQLNGHMGKQHLWQIKENMTSHVLIAHVGQLNGHTGRQRQWQINKR
jgi:hypothetical protein